MHTGLRLYHYCFLRCRISANILKWSISTVALLVLVVMMMVILTTIPRIVVMIVQVRKEETVERKVPNES